MIGTMIPISIYNVLGSFEQYDAFFTISTTSLEVLENLLGDLGL